MTPAAVDASLDDDELRPPSLIADNQQLHTLGQVQPIGCKETDAVNKVDEEEDALPSVAPSPRTAQLAPPAEPGVRVVADLLRAPTAEAQKSQLVTSLGCLYCHCRWVRAHCASTTRFSTRLGFRAGSCWAQSAPSPCVAGSSSPISAPSGIADICTFYY
ncbi:hypothetical protein GQ600_23483 [Phytophthora cactorum]|nr:hypothetical protein GQ600_23483 [Phytophthora cactorum]